MRIYNIATCREYTKKGEIKRKYYKAGELHIDESSGRMFMRLYHNPTIPYYVFDNTEKISEPANEADVEEQAE